MQAAKAARRGDCIGEHIQPESEAKCPGESRGSKTEETHVPNGLTSAVQAFCDETSNMEREQPHSPTLRSPKTSAKLLSACLTLPDIALLALAPERTSAWMSEMLMTLPFASSDPLFVPFCTVFFGAKITTPLSLAGGQG